MIDPDMQQGFTRLETVIDKLANLCAREFKLIAERFATVDQHFSAIDERFTAVDESLKTIEGRIEAFARRVDNEVEERHVLGERVSKLEKAA